MLDIPALLDAAKARHGFRSDAQLSRALGLTDTIVNQYRRGITRLSPEIARALAELAGVDARATVLAVLSIGTRDDHLRSLYRDIARKISVAVVLVAVAFSSSSFGRPKREQISVPTARPIHYAIIDYLRSDAAATAILQISSPVPATNGLRRETMLPAFTT